MRDIKAIDNANMAKVYIRGAIVLTDLLKNSSEWNEDYIRDAFFSIESVLDLAINELNNITHEKGVRNG
ncbi:hypothetical protein FJR45_00375 [Sulfurimonas sediminis]|uniref:Uncharacterized protein n=1 Tax=Sulfurimonas sediminis TaxID=2590020 RepID=A0A7M1AYG9_9BACT|nr:hypothetical protein [Sulfurimonas sediminis]QOP42491.1 hypothetical protein FJR45_00375 [Sulfurimonas sediminis]